MEENEVDDELPDDLEVLSEENDVISVSDGFPISCCKIVGRIDLLCWNNHVRSLLQECTILYSFMCVHLEY